MQEIRNDGSSRLTDFDKLIPEIKPGHPIAEMLAAKLAEKIADPENQSVSLHKAGSVVKMADGTEYFITETGAWNKIKEKDM